MNTLINWYQVSEQLREIKKQELALRKQVVEEYFPELDEGANTTDIEGDAVLTATLPYSYSVDPDSLEAGLAHVPATKQEKLINWKPSLSLTVYRSLSKKARDAFTAECVTVKPGTPSLKITPAKS